MSENNKSEPAERMPSRSELSAFMDAWLLADVPLAGRKVIDICCGKAGVMNTSGPLQIRIRKSELANLCGVHAVRTDRLKVDLDILMDIKLRVTAMKTEGRSDLEFRLVQNCEILSGPDVQAVEIAVQFTDMASMYFLSGRYQRMLRACMPQVMKLRSCNAYRFYEYIIWNAGRAKWTVPIDDIRKFFHCSDSRTYDEYKYLKKQILQKNQAEIQTKTGTCFSCNPVRTGRKVIAVTFSCDAKNSTDEQGGEQ